ncbi:hypothetical protein OAH18_01715 [bacterium]|nr:hypothetical protein [bacterium]
MYAIERQKFDIAHSLIDAGADVTYSISKRMKCGFSILTHALTTSRWDTTVFDRVAQVDCEINAFCDAGSTALKQAIASWRIDPDHQRKIELLIQNGALADFRPPVNMPLSSQQAETAREYADRVPLLPDTLCDLLDVTRKQTAV